MRPVIVCLVAAGLLLGGCSATVPESPAGASGATEEPTTATAPVAVSRGDRPPVAPDSFYDLGGPVPAGRNGEILRRLELAGNDAVRVWVVLYRSTGLDGSPIAVSGTVAVPTAPAPAGGWPIFAWAHGTTGIADSCAPSRLGPDGGLPNQWLPFVTAGFVVTATDYDGLGTPGVHPYGVGLSQGRSILDSIRAARQLGEAGAGSVVTVGGHSEGGHGALWAAELVNSYAPELTITAVLASAPGGDTVSQAKALDKETTFPASRNLELLIRSWQSVYRLPVDNIMDVDQAQILPEADQNCLSGLTGVKVKAGFASDPDWAPRLEQNSPAGRHIDAPILYLQGTADEQIPIDAARSGRDRLCADRDVIEYREFDGEDHDSPLFNHEDDAITWVKDRVAGEPARNTCR